MCVPCVCEFKTGPHSTAALTCGGARPRGARLHDYSLGLYWQQASKRGAAKEVRFPGFRPDGDGERRAVCVPAPPGVLNKMTHLDPRSARFSSSVAGDDRSTVDHAKDANDIANVGNFMCALRPARPCFSGEWPAAAHSVSFYAQRMPRSPRHDARAQP